jgi:KUP system potassium uptake protein
MGALTLGALGVVFGDIGTSPLYALHTVFSASHGKVQPVQDDVYGVISLVVWSITFIVSVKYVTYIMRADNDGEGGIMALIALIQSASLRGRAAQAALVALGIFGASLFYGDGMITPAISVLSAVEGLEVVSSSFESLVVPLTLVVIAGLFAIQSRGTSAVGRLFGPVMGVWFSVLALGGLGQIVKHPEVIKALSPTYGVQFFLDHGSVAFVALASVVLAVTGAEALYADMGHFGRRPIRRAWFFFVFPALTLNYLGQAALILHREGALENPFFLLFPSWARLPMVLLATLATVIASQAVISGAFSVTRQAVQLGFLPRMTIQHTSAHEIGQVYVPAINWGIFGAVVALVIGFGSSSNLASAYGIAVTGTLVIDTILFFVVVRVLWKKPMSTVIAGAAAFLVVDLAFFGANLTKVLHGGWFPLTIALAVFIVLTTWQREGPLEQYVAELHEFAQPIQRVAGTALFLNARADTTPLAMRANVEHNHTLHESVVILSMQTMKVPHVPPDERLTIDDLGFTDDGITHVSARLGFQDDTDVPALFRLAAAHGLEMPVDVDNASYFISRITLTATDQPTMAMWRKRLFLGISRNASDPVEYFGLPLDRTVIMGSRVEF